MHVPGTVMSSCFQLQSFCTVCYAKPQMNWSTNLSLNYLNLHLMTVILARNSSLNSMQHVRYYVPRALVLNAHLDSNLQLTSYLFSVYRLCAAEKCNSLKTWSISAYFTPMNHAIRPKAGRNGDNFHGKLHPSGKCLEHFHTQSPRSSRHFVRSITYLMMLQVIFHEIPPLAA